MSGLTKTESALLAGFAAAVLFPLLYIARRLDDNTLTSWRWVWTDQNIGLMLLVCLAAVLVAYMLARTDLFDDQPVSWLLFLSLIIGLSIRDMPELLLDSSRYFLQAKYAARYGAPDFFRQWGHAMPAWTDMPLVPFLYGMLLRIFGENRPAIQLYNCLIFAGGVALTYLTARFFLDRKSSFNAALFLLGMPYLLTQIPLLLVDVHVLFFYNLALYLFLRAVHDGGAGKVTLAAGGIALAMLVKFSTWPMLLLLPLLAGLCFYRGNKRALIRAGAVFCLAAGFFTLYLAPKFEVVLEQLELLRTYQAPALQVWSEGLVSTFFFQIHPFIIFFAVLALVVLYRRGQAELLVIALFIGFFFFTVQRIRYIIPLLPLLAIIGAAGLELLRFAETRRFIGLLAAGFAVIIVHSAYMPFFQTTGMANIRNAGRYLDTIDSDAVEVHILPQEQSRAPSFLILPQLDLFSRKTFIAPQQWPRKTDSPAGYHPLRFAWTMPKPAAYSADRLTIRDDTPLVVISGAPVDEGVINAIRANPAFTTVRHFNACSGVFRYKTFIAVFQ